MTSTPGVQVTGSVLDRIVADAADPLAKAKIAAPESILRQEAQTFSNGHALGHMIDGPQIASDDGHRMALIAEVKKASPSKGVFAENLDYLAIARSYVNGGAVGISVVTEENYFLGKLQWLKDIRLMLQTEFAGRRPSLLRKDFIFDPYQLVQARAYGADNVLLIVAMLDDVLLRDLLQTARGLDLDALVEVHTESEAERAVAASATLYGINNRNLHTFDVDLATTERIRPLLPADAIVIGESGVRNRADVERLHKAGVHAILVGEAFMTAPNVAAKMAELRL